MATENRLIDANALKEKLQGHHDFFVEGVGGFRYLTPKDKARVDEIDNCIAEIVNAPTVDAVEVVRCYECKKNGNDEECPLLSMMQYTEDDDFCSYGERREGE